MKISIGNKIALGFIAALIALLIIGAVSYRNVNELNNDEQWVNHTYIVLNKLEKTLSNLVEVQSYAYSYKVLPGVNGEDAFKKYTSDINENLQNLRFLTQDNPHQQARLDHLETLLKNRLNTLQKVIDLRQGDSPKKDTQLTALVVEGGKQSEAIQKLISEAEDEENSLLKLRNNRSDATAYLTSLTIILGTITTVLVISAIGYAVTKSITGPIKALQLGAMKIGSGNYGHRVQVNARDETGNLALLFNKMATEVQQRQLLQDEQDWLKTNLNHIAIQMQGQRKIEPLCSIVLNELARILEVPYLVIYTPDFLEGNQELKLRAGYAVKDSRANLKPGEGLIGQAYLGKKKIVLNDIPKDYIKINSALGESTPTFLVIIPSLFENQVKAVIELAAFKKFTNAQSLFLNQFVEILGIVLSAVEATMLTEVQKESLQKSEHLLQEQQEELQQSNEELEQTNEELRQLNEEMEEREQLLVEQKKEIEDARSALEDKAGQLAAASKYKSEFLANMSHELRTPLNSLLILSKMLADNLENNLTEKQVQYAKTIYSSGNDLLELINDVLDLAKVESGTVILDIEKMPFATLVEFVENTFRHVAQSKKLDFDIRLDPNLPREMTTDIRRTEQILKNLLSNAFKFTEKGSVKLEVKLVHGGWDHSCKMLVKAGSAIAFSITDTGIGIPPEKQQLIFEAFQQAEAGTARKYGGTGLGLSISREIVQMLEGYLKLESVPNKGSTFTLYLPLTLSEKTENDGEKESQYKPRLRTLPPSSGAKESEVLTDDFESEPRIVDDDLPNLQSEDRILLIIEDDKNFAEILVNIAREKKFKAVNARSASRGIALAIQLQPAAITLDLKLPDKEGWMVLDQLKHDPRTRHIPVHLISVEERGERSLQLGSVSYLKKPVTKELIEQALDQTIDFVNRPVKNLLVIEDDSVQRDSIVQLIGNGDVKTTAVGTGKAALEAMETSHFDCVVLDLSLPDVKGVELIRGIQKKAGNRPLPIIVYTGRELTRQEEMELRLIAESIIIKDVRSPERLLDETALFLHRVQSKLPESKRRIIEQVQKTDSILSNRKILVVDDDVRNIFAITSALERYQMKVSYAESGREGIERLQSEPDIEIVLMDVMMPEMDGFEAIRQIRQIPRFKNLPVISITAKAMKGDREKCLEAGASDYITKPIDMDRLSSLLRVWLYK